MVKREEGMVPEKWLSPRFRRESMHCDRTGGFIAPNSIIGFAKVAMAAIKLVHELSESLRLIGMTSNITAVINVYTEGA
ncbi:hypothetical protein IGI04_016541 [Brassica rapa subsp. trilocularis]|uniref:Uncharacterized protein n=1 Tax=Brassica rapa subsp. trilocularis TaxID=1813537 RepID=A0ABQ7MTA8_BRACM|nr:hypothetical protein IGI04_016541 [Brassica rapa subsp. trilocularis]